MSDNDTKITLEDAQEKEGKTDWDHMEGLADEQIRRAAEEDPDQFLLDEEWFENATLVMT